MEQQKLIPHLFRTEFRKITAVLTRFLGIEHLELAEDLVSETFILALETWPRHGIPHNPSAWLYTVAKNKAKNQLKRQQLFQGKIMPDLMSTSSQNQEPELDLSPQNITDSQLQMLFAICHPAIPVEAQIGLALRTLCGFGIDEIAIALVKGNAVAILEAEKLKLENNHFYYALLGELYSSIDPLKANIYLEKALAIAKTQTDKQTIQKKIEQVKTRI